MAYLISTCFVGADAIDFTWLLLLGGLSYLVSSYLTAVGAAHPEDEGIETIEQKLEELMRIEAILKADYGRGVITEERYNKGLMRVQAARKKFESKLEDTIVAMITPAETSEQQPRVMSDPLIDAAWRRDNADREVSTDDKEPLVKIMEIKRGRLNDTRALEVNFFFREKQCKAIIDNDEGQWRFSNQAENLYHGQFINALEKSPRFAEVFKKEIRRHPDDWHEVVVKGKSYAKGGMEKNTRDNFPQICNQIIAQYSTLRPSKPSHKPAGRKKVGVDLTGETVVINKVECGEYTKVERKDFGKGFLEFPRYITVILDWGKYSLKAEITTDNSEWEVVPRDPSRDCPQELLLEIIQVIPFMVQELDQPGNKYLARAMLTEMRRKEQRHQWETIVTDGSSLSWPYECRELFQKSNG